MLSFTGSFKVFLAVEPYYALGQWPAMEQYLKDGRVLTDSNPTENAIRPTAIGKKNWLCVTKGGP